MAKSLRESLLATSPQPRIIPYVTLGDPPDGRFEAWVDELLDGGSFALEVGLPSSGANEGPVLLRSHERALRAGLTEIQILDRLATTVRRIRCPVIAVVHFRAGMGNDIGRVIEALAETGVAAVLCVGLPVYALPELAEAARQSDVETVLSVHGEMPERLRETVYRAASGCIYLSRRRMVTMSEAEESALCRMVSAETSLPVIVGTGIRDAETVTRFVRAGARACAVGTALIEKWERRLRDAPDASSSFADDVRALSNG